MGEKFDGVRAVWNPSKSELYTKKGANMLIPQSISRKMPEMFLDGEVYRFLRRISYL